MVRGEDGGEGGELSSLDNSWEEPLRGEKMLRSG